MQDDGLVIMEQSLPQFSESIPLEVITDVFDKSIIVDGLTPQIVSTGLRDIMLPVQTREQLFSFKPDFGKMADMNKKTNSIGVHAFTLDTIDPKSIAHCRNFAPLYGITEESATGSSNGALACYLYHHGKLNDRSLHDMKFEQGYSMNKPSEIFVDWGSRWPTNYKSHCWRKSNIIWGKGNRNLKYLNKKSFNKAKKWIQENARQLERALLDHFLQ